MDLEKFFQFVEFTNQLRLVKRSVETNDKAKENVMEHSFQLAMICWYIIDDQKLDLNLKKVFEYCLAHDLIEVYSGDTNPYTSNKNYFDSKEQRENEAFSKIKAKFPALISLHKAIEEYETQANKEANFVSGLDGLIPGINTFIVGDDFYSKSGVTIEKYTNWNLNKVKRDDFSTGLMEDIKNHFLKYNPDFFAKD